MASLGQTLVDERRRQGKTLADVEAATHIRGRLLEALENDEWDNLPAPAYVRGYIQSYAAFLGIPAEPLLTAYTQEARPARDRARVRLPEPVVPTREETRVPAARTGLMIAGGVVVLALVVWGIASATRGSRPEILPVGPNASSVASDTTAAPLGGAPGVAGDETETPTVREPAPKKTPFDLTVRVADDGVSWLLIRVDGLKAYEGTLAGGQSKTYNVLDRAEVTIGKPSFVTVLRDGEKVDIPDGQGTPKVTLKATDE